MAEHGSKATEGGVHGTVSADGTEIAGRVLGRGPAIVFVHGGLGDEDSWRFMLPFLQDHFTCYTLSTRGRGLSSDNPDHSWDRIVEDVRAFAESIGEPVGMVGHSSGGALALEATSRTEVVLALALFEPTVFRIGADHQRDAQRDERGFERIHQLAEEGKLVDAVRVFVEEIAVAEQSELDGMLAAGAYDAMAPNLTAFLQEMVSGPGVTDPSVLARLTIPVLLAYGTETAPFSKTVVQLLAEQLPDTQVREVEGAAHFAPLVAPEPVAEELSRFFSAALAKV